MRAKRAGWMLAVLTLSAVAAEAAPKSPADDLPATLDRVTGHPAVAYAFFGLMALFAVLLIYRGVRAR